jgi:RHS repeat-associated protein
VQYWNGSTWTTIPGGNVTGNNKVWRKFTFSPITTSKIRVTINSVPDAWSRVVEIQAFGTSAGGEKVQWLVPDHLGTPRIILDQTGALANVKRHDYLPFGEELFAGTGGRTVAQGYAGDGVRQQFTSKERDVETGLDYFGARYYSSLQGRFTSADPLMASGRASVPQSWNRYSIVLNNPSKLIDPNGLEDNDPQEPKKKEDRKPTKTALPKVTVTTSTDPRGANGTEPKVNVPLPDGDYATGIIAPLTITVTDESGEPLKGLTITETNKVIEAEPELPFMENTKTVTTDSNGSFTDLVYGNATITSEPVSGEAAAKIIKNQRENRSRVVTEQTLTIADGQEVIATAVYRRTFTNLDNKGNLRSPTNKLGRPVNNFSMSVGPVTVSPPKSP